MSNSLAIAAVTTTLRNLLTRQLGGELGSGGVTTRPLDKARDSSDPNQLNLFLYHLIPDPAWRNRELPNRTRPGETGQPPLPLKLYYLLTAYGRENDDTLGHRILGRAMQILHDHAILSPAEIRAALPDSDLQNQIDRIRLSLQPVSLDEMSRLWSSFQTQYRISAAYEVSVVLIESQQASKTPLPVLTVGPDDSGIFVQPNLMLPFPALETVLYRQGRSALLGMAADGQADLTLQGQNLDGPARVLFRHPRLTQPLEPAQVLSGTALSGTPTALPLVLPQPGEPTDPNAPMNQWLAGLYRVKAVISPAAVPPNSAVSDRTTNELAVELAPRILTDSLTVRRDPPNNADPSGRVVITLRCLPAVARSQPVSLLLGDRELPWLPPALPDPAPANPDLLRFSELRFEAKGLPPGDYWLRLRVDGVDSPLIVTRTTPAGTVQPGFDPTQRITVP